MITTSKGRRAAIRQVAYPAKTAGRGRKNRRGASRSRACCATSVTDDEIARIVARWTGIPVSKLDGRRAREAAAPGRTSLHQRVIGQDEAVQKVSDAILRSRAGYRQPEPPHRLLPVPRPHRRRQDRTGQRRWPQALFDDEKNMVRIDMTEYMEKFSVSRLIGAPPGYVGYEEGGQLTEAVRRHPYTRRAV